MLTVALCYLALPEHQGNQEVPQYRQKPVVIDAFQLGRDKQPTPVPDWACGHPGLRVTTNGVAVNTPTGVVHAVWGDYIIRDAQDVLSLCPPAVFNTLYELVDTTQPTQAEVVHRGLQQLLRHNPGAMATLLAPLFWFSSAEAMAAQDSPFVAGPNNSINLLGIINGTLHAGQSPLLVAAMTTEPGNELVDFMLVPNRITDVEPAAAPVVG